MRFTLYFDAFAADFAIIISDADAAADYFLFAIFLYFLLFFIF